MLENKSAKPNYKKLLDKDDPIDKLILELAKKGKLNVGVVWVKEEPENYSECYSYKDPIENIWKKLKNPKRLNYIIYFFPVLAWLYFK